VQHPAVPSILRNSTNLLTPPSSLSVVPGTPLFEDDMQAALFIGADPANATASWLSAAIRCSRRTTRAGKPAPKTTAPPNQHQLLEVSATYPTNFDAAVFLDSIRKDVSGCQRTVTAWGDDGIKRTVDPAPLVASSPEVPSWATNLAGQQWICEFAVIAKAQRGVRDRHLLSRPLSRYPGIGSQAARERSTNYSTRRIDATETCSAAGNSDLPGSPGTWRPS